VAVDFALSGRWGFIVRGPGAMDEPAKKARVSREIPAHFDSIGGAPRKSHGTLEIS
jgi:hypothetical protein